MFHRQGLSPAGGHGDSRELGAACVIAGQASWGAQFWKKEDAQGYVTWCCTAGTSRNADAQGKGPGGQGKQDGARALGPLLGPLGASLTMVDLRVGIRTWKKSRL